MTTPSMRIGSAVDDARLRDFLVESLTMWNVAATVEVGVSPVVACIRAEAGTLIWVERPVEADAPFRWFVRWRLAEEAPGSAREQRPRPCTSIVGLLNALRGVLGVDRGGRARIVPGAVAQ